MKDKKRFTDFLKEHIKKELKQKGINALSLILEEVRNLYSKKIREFGIKDAEQSWKPFKGSLLEEVILDYIIFEAEKIGLKTIKGKNLEKKTNERLGECLSLVKRSIAIDYGEFGLHLPDADIVIYDPEKCKAVAIISSKTTLRERIAETGYWYLKLKSDKITENIKVFFVTLDEDGDLTVKFPSKKGRAIAETDTDGTFVITTLSIEEGEKVKKIEKILNELRRLKI